jgi:transcriptional regulator with XRE-family HTH domain
MDIRTIRHLNLLRLVREAGGQKPLAERAGVSAAYLSQVLSRKVNRHVGHSLARRLEAGTAKPYGWMDVLADREPAAGGAVREVDGAAPYGRGRPNGARRARLLLLAREAGGMDALAARCGVHAPYLAGVAEGAGFPGGFPDDLARRLEAGMGKPAGWLDLGPGGAP